MENMMDNSQCARKGVSSADFRHRGFSLVELMISVTLIAIGTALALPSYQDMIEKRQVTSSAEQLAALINSAQGLAAKTTENAVVTYWKSDDEQWCVGTAGKTYCDERVQQMQDHEIGQQCDGKSCFAFTPVRGILEDVPDSAFFQAELRSESGDFRLNLVVNSVGRIILCSVDGHAVPGYALCPPTSSDAEA
jgi:prepilin-type N-terminal cleavage/methylation domain-containing protein